MVEMVSANFSRDEFACKCGCGFDVVDVKLVKILQDIRSYFGIAITINSACRCISHNHTVSGSTKSQHRLGKAADIVMEGISPQRVHLYLNSKYPQSLGLGLYESFVHVDVRSEHTRWEG